MNHDIAVFKNIPFTKEGSRFIQLRVEMFNAFNHTEFRSVNNGTQLVTSSGAIGNAIRSTAPLGSFFGEPNAARSVHHPFGMKIHF